MKAHLDAQDGIVLVGDYNCRPSTGGSGLSHHANRTAIDSFVHLRDIEDPPEGDELVHMLWLAGVLVALAEPLGIQRIIRLDREWDSRPGQRYWAKYPPPGSTGLFHGNHLHVELCNQASFDLTLPEIQSVWPTDDDQEDTMVYSQLVGAVAYIRLDDARRDEFTVKDDAAGLGRLWQRFTRDGGTTWSAWAQPIGTETGILTGPVSVSADPKANTYEVAGPGLEGRRFVNRYPGSGATWDGWLPLSPDPAGP